MSESPSPPGPSFRSTLHRRLRRRLEGSARTFPDGDCLRVDLHCHDQNSDVPDELWGRILRLPETWLEPRRLLKSLRRNGATAFTITNHNNARSCWELLGKGRDVLSGAEWTCLFPEYGIWIHVLVYGFTPEQEGELERRRRNIYDFLRYCRREDLPVVQPHPLHFHAREHAPTLDIYEKFALLFERFEVCNGQRGAWQNLLVWEWIESLDRERLEGYARKHDLDPHDFCADPWTKACAGGSDDHIGLLAGLTGTLLHVPDLPGRLAAGAQPSQLALEALRAKRMAPFGCPTNEENLSVALLDYLAQAAIHHEDPGLLRVLLHKGEAADKLWCLGIANFLAELRRHKYTMRFLKAWHACLHGEKPGLMLKLMVNRDYRPFLAHLTTISKVRRRTPEALTETLRTTMAEMFHELMHLTLCRARKGLTPIVASWKEAGGGRELRFDDWIEHLEAPTHFRVLLGLEKKERSSSQSALQVSSLLDGMCFPSLMAAVLAGMTAISAYTLHARRDLHNELAETCGGTPHPRRVLWLTDTFVDANGVSSALQSVLEEVRRRDLPIDFLICHAEHEPGDHLRVVRPLEEFFLPGFGEQPFRIPDILEVLRLVQDEGYDRLVVSTEGVLGWIGLFLKHALQLRAHFFVHTDWLEFLAHNSSLDQRGLDRVRRMLRWFYRQWDGLFVLNRQHHEWLAGEAMAIPGERLHRTAHWVAPEFRADLPSNPDLLPGPGPILVYAGRLSEEKGVLDVVAAWDIIRARLPEARLVFAGRGPAEPELRRLAPEAHFTGWVDRESLAGWFRAGTLLLFPSRFDTFGCAVLEALSCGLPVACYPVKGPADLVEDGVNGLLCRDPGDMASRVIALLEEPVRLEVFRNGALETARRYRAHEIMDRMLEDLGLAPCGTGNERVSGCARV